MKSPKDKSQQKSKRTKATSEATAEAGGVAELSTSLSAQRSGDHPVKLEPKETESCISPASTVAELNENDPKAASSASDSQTSVIITSSVPNSQATSVIKQLIKVRSNEVSMKPRSQWY